MAALFDTVACASFVGKAVLLRGIRKHGDLVDHENPLRVQFGDQKHKEYLKAFLMLLKSRKIRTATIYSEDAGLGI